MNEEFTHLGEKFQLSRKRTDNVTVELHLWDLNYWKQIGFIDVNSTIFYLYLYGEYLDLLERLWSFVWTIVESEMKGQTVTVRWLYDEESKERLKEKRRMIKRLLNNYSL
jgi:hypothetical protein